MQLHVGMSVSSQDKTLTETSASGAIHSVSSATALDHYLGESLPHETSQRKPGTLSDDLRTNAHRPWTAIGGIHRYW